MRTGEKSARFGVKLTATTRNKISNSLKGRFRKHKNPNWKNGGIAKFRKIVMGQFEYSEWRKSVYKRDNYICQLCDRPSTGNIEAHHIYPVNIKPELIVDVNNGITLCKTCHRSIRGKELNYVEKFKQTILR